MAVERWTHGASPTGLKAVGVTDDRAILVTPIPDGQQYPTDVRSKSVRLKPSTDIRRMLDKCSEADVPTRMPRGPPQYFPR